MAFVNDEKNIAASVKARNQSDNAFYEAILEYFNPWKFQCPMR